MEARATGTGLSRGGQTGWREACRGAQTGLQRKRKQEGGATEMLGKAEGD